MNLKGELLFIVLKITFYSMLRALVGWFCAACATGRRSAARQGIAVVRSSSAGAGVVSTDILFEGMDGMFAAGSLSAPRTRIALQ